MPIPDPLLPGLPEAEEIERAPEEIRSPKRRSVAVNLGQMARQAEYFAEQWSEIPAAALEHRTYARLFRAAAACPEAFYDREAWEQRCTSRAIKLAWRAYWQSTTPRVPPDAQEVVSAAQCQKVDTYWAMRLWELIEGDPVRLSVLRARDFELQRLCDDSPYRADRISLIRTRSRMAYRPAGRRR